MKILVCLEAGVSGTGAFVPECLGCWVFSRNPERALKKVRAAIAEWFLWLNRHGELTPDLSEFDIDVAEVLRVTYNPVEAGKPEPLFWSEVLPIDHGDIAWTIRLMEYSRSDLLRLVSNLSNEILDWQPPNEPRTIRNCLRHIGIIEWWYITRLNIDLPEEFPEDIFELLSQTRKMVIASLKKPPKEKRSRVYQPKKHVDPEAAICNLWTARKVLRRLVDYERLHARYIQRILQII